ncbi:1846_t:CDS:10 [Ambispora gerdemannii]|uniref:1846_t:CDS:1 n=1 Tax=Ambispora gerdemannii TaxID=144530 RepID=A0A9N8YV18_9GLOM|nr:1846_t:CDS:10 [Ambispora gerdemannii]
MCGILVQFVRQHFAIDNNNGKNNNDTCLGLRLIEQNKKRGPDAQNYYHEIITLSNDNKNNDTIAKENERSDYLEFYGATLHLRGQNLMKQPVRDNDRVLLWNGEIFDGIEVSKHENDTEKLFEALKSCDQAAANVNNMRNNSERDELNPIAQTLAKIEGPFSFVYWESSRRKLWFGRDCLGRRSLLWHLPTSKSDRFILTSVGEVNNKSKKIDDSTIPIGRDEQNNGLHFEEVPATGFFCLNLDDVYYSGFNELDEYLIDFFSYQAESFEKLFIHYPWSHENDEVNAPPQIENIKHMATLPNLDDLSILPSSIESSFVPEISTQMREAINRMISELGDSVRKRVESIPSSGTSPKTARLGILFSGGLDCICLAALSDKYLPLEDPIDLLNVSFENPRKVSSDNNKKNLVDANAGDERSISLYDVPDRLTGREGYQELKYEKKILPNRPWRLVEINVPYTETLSHRSTILELMAPLDTIMDLSIAMAFWFAARGKGQIESLDSPGQMHAYESKAKVLLVGVGADELLAGYSRHREAFRQAGWERLIKEVQLDVDRISTRNLGRDDRIISSHGKESRYPYLSENVVRFLCSLPMYLKADMRFPRGIGEKLLLRHVARELGLVNASVLRKRAIQFGARTAKMTSGESKSKGHMKAADLSEE